MKYKLGKQPARPNSIPMKFASYFDAAKLPKPPPVLGHELIGHDWGMLGNDQHSDCTFAGGAHETMIFGHMGSRKQAVNFTTENVLADYTVLSPNDDGCDMAAVAEYRRTVGLMDATGVRHKIDAYVALPPGDADTLALAIYLTGAVGIGINTPDNVDKLFDAHLPWDITPGTRIEGGHYIPAMLRSSAGLFGVVTWGGIQGVYPDFISKYCDESVMYISLEILEARGLSPDGFGIDEIRRDIAALGG